MKSVAADDLGSCGKAGETVRHVSRGYRGTQGPSQAQDSVSIVQQGSPRRGRLGPLSCFLIYRGTRPPESGAAFSTRQPPFSWRGLQEGEAGKRTPGRGLLCCSGGSHAGGGDSEEWGR